MITIYKFDHCGKDHKVGRFDTQSEYEAIGQYVESINGEIETFRPLGSLSGMVYRLSFEMTVNGETNEYFLVQMDDSLIDYFKAK